MLYIHGKQKVFIPASTAKSDVCLWPLIRVSYSIKQWSILLDSHWGSKISYVLQQDDILWFIDDSIKNGSEQSNFRKNRIGGDQRGTAYWYAAY